MQISAYIPCYNNACTIRQAIESIQAQTHPISELFVVDDGSEDQSAKIAEALTVRVIRCPKRSGRGAARARAMNEAKHELVLCLDGSKALPTSFVENALRWFQEGQVAAVFGRIVQPSPKNVAERWCGRHLLKEDLEQAENRKGPLITAGAIVRTSAVMQIGNYNSALSYAEDRELGERLLAVGFDVVFDPALCVTSLTDGDLWSVLERYWRWHAPIHEQISCYAYLKQIVYSMKVMAVEDLLAGDPWSVPISLLSPHYQLWRSLKLSVPRNNSPK